MYLLYFCSCEVRNHLSLSRSDYFWTSARICFGHLNGFHFATFCRYFTVSLCLGVLQPCPFYKWPKWQDELKNAFSPLQESNKEKNLKFLTRVCAGSAVKMQTCINFCETATILTSFWEENFERTLNFQAFSVFALLEFFSAQKLNWNGQNWFGNVSFKFQTQY